MATELFKGDKITYKLVERAFDSCLYGKHYDGFCSVTKPEHLEKLFRLMGYDIPATQQTIVYVYNQFYDELSQAVLHIDDRERYMEGIPPLVRIWFHEIYDANDNKKVSHPIAATLELLKHKKQPRLLITKIAGSGTGVDVFEVSMYEMGACQTSRERVQVRYDSFKKEETVSILGGTSVKS
jgi:hypothetical protein